MILSRDGGIATMVTLCIDSLSITTDRVSLVAVAVNAITLTVLGMRLRRWPILANAFLT